MSSLHLAGQRIGNVRIDSMIGEGANGVVYRGEHTTLSITVAVKIYKLDVQADDHGRRLERFRREAQLMARLNHPGIVRVHDFGDLDGRPYIVMDFIDGFSLAEFVQRRNTPIKEELILKILLGTANALHAAHRAGIVHRDLKPANLLLSRSGKLYLADLGLAREEGMAGLTHNRIVVGSPAYMSPESFTAGRSVDSRHDLYSLGVVGYELCFGKPPFEGSVAEVMRGHLQGSARFDLPSTCSSGLLRVIRTLMAYDPDARYQSAEQVAAELRNLLAGGTSRIKKKRSRPGDSGATSASASGTDFSGIIRFLDDRLRAETSFVDGGRVVHSTARERLLVWLLLVAVLGIAGFGYYWSHRASEPAVVAPVLGNDATAQEGSE